MLDLDTLTVEVTVKVCEAEAGKLQNQQLKRLVDDGVGVGFRVYRHLSTIIEKQAWRTATCQ